MLNIFEQYNQEASDLHHSLKVSGYTHPTIVLTETGFLPDDVISPYGYFTGDYLVEKGYARYFNQVRVPDFWEIKANNTNGEIVNHGKKVANIFFVQPSHKRLVRAVEWLDDNGNVKIIEFYNKHGRHYATSTFNSDRVQIMKTYYDLEGKEKIVENFVTGDIILNIGDQVKIFHTRVEFIIHFLKDSGYQLDSILYNSLATPFQVAYRLNTPGSDILVWQEDFQGAIPGNMQLLIDDKLPRSTKIVIPKQSVYQQFLNLNHGQPSNKVASLGYIYPLYPQNNWSNDILTFTNSDQLENIEKLAQSLPEMNFHIAAITEMSPKLLSLGGYENVFLYPNVTDAVVSQLWNKAHVYLDNNHGNEILSASREAFLRQIPILAFDNTCHGRDYTLLNNYFSASDAEKMVVRIKELNQESMYQDVVSNQLRAGNHVQEKEYREVLSHD